MTPMDGRILVLLAGLALALVAIAVAAFRGSPAIWPGRISAPRRSPWSSRGW
jgi:hypothetical protein